MYTTGSGPFGESSGQPMPMAVESFQALKERQTSEDVGVGAARTSRVNLLNWDGKGSPETMFAPRPGSPRIPSAGDER
jgi:nitrate reductase beta subunit